jgi:hypothetical protein
VKKLILCAAMALLTLAPMAGAQQLPPGKWWRRPELVRNLGLSTEQQTKLDEVFRSKADALIDTKGEVEKLQISLRGELERSQLRRAEIQKIAARLNEARGRLFESELMMLVDMRAILTEQQWEKVRGQLDRMQEQRRENRNNRPGMPQDGQQPPRQRQ